MHKTQSKKSRCLSPHLTFVPILPHPNSSHIHSTVDTPMPQATVKLNNNTQAVADSPRDSMSLVEFGSADGVQLPLAPLPIQIQHALRVMPLRRLHPRAVSYQLFAALSDTTSTTTGTTVPVGLADIRHGAVNRLFPLGTALIGHRAVALGHVARQHLVMVILVPAVHPAVPAAVLMMVLMLMMMLLVVVVGVDDGVPPLVVLGLGFGRQLAVDAADVGHGAVMMPAVLARGAGRGRHAARDAHVGHGAVPLEGLAAGGAAARGRYHAVAALARRAAVFPGGQGTLGHCLAVPSQPVGRR